MQLTLRKRQEHLTGRWLREAGGAVEDAANLKLELAAVLAWLDVTGVTGYYASQRDQAAQALLDAWDETRKLTAHIDRARPDEEDPMTKIGPTSPCEVKSMPLTMAARPSNREGPARTRQADPSL